MITEDIKGIITFAIEKEQEAADFYTDLARKVKSEDVAKELVRFAEMEMGHKKMLQNIDLEKFNESEPAQIKDLKIANYTVDAIPQSNMSWPDIVNIAMHREMAAANLYNDLADVSLEPSIKNLFKKLASEEQKHKLYFETVWDQDVMKEN